MLIGEIVARLIEAGTPPELAAIAVTEAFAAGAKSADIRRQSADETTEKRRAYDRERARIKRGHPPTSADYPRSPQNALSIKEDSKKDRKRKGERIPVEWTPSTEDQSFALTKGMTLERITLETEKFRNYWTAKSGVSAVKLDWSATWRNWVLSSLERVPGLPTGPPERPDFTKPPADYEARRAAYLAEKAKENGNDTAQGAGVRGNAGVGKNGAGVGAELSLSSGATLRGPDCETEGRAPDD